MKDRTEEGIPDFPETISGRKIEADSKANFRNGNLDRRLKKAGCAEWSRIETG
jgi:hypothetical protein